MSYADRFKEGLARPGKDRAGAAKAIGITKQAVGQIANGITKSATAENNAAAAAYFGCDPTWLASGKGSPAWNDTEPSNVTEVTPRASVPLISWVAAGLLGDVQDNFHPGEADEWVDVYDTKPGGSAFALRVDGDSMTSPYPNDYTFPHGTIIVVDPMRGADAGHFVVAKDVTTQKATFKKLTTDGGRWFLKPLNPTYPTVEIDDPAFRVIGRVIESMTRQKL